MSLKDLSKELKRQLKEAEARHTERERDGKDSMGFGLIIDTAVIVTLRRVIEAVKEAEKNGG